MQKNLHVILLISLLFSAVKAYTAQPNAQEAPEYIGICPMTRFTKTMIITALFGATTLAAGIACERPGIAYMGTCGLLFAACGMTVKVCSDAERQRAGYLPL